MPKHLEPWDFAFSTISPLGLLISFKNMGSKGYWWWIGAGKTDGDYLHILQQILRPIASEYKPEFILVSAGFDIYEGDPLGGMQITKQGFAALASELLSLATAFSQKRLLCILEGGYDLQGLHDGVEQVLYQLAGEASKPAIESTISSIIDQELAPVLETQKKYWTSVDP
jgi:acetoin utilization deacetylase AcuC-like enzyme